ncbi:MAG: hypothetical protein IGR92_06440 [Leptolyngbyaceae cyanobacterium T60_A2020_046]|nr:hypothetical protein [Leptolyngbyaceae cyanobacterium T60_A2020_046]
MATFSAVTMRNGSEDAEIWASLRDAIASSSGFQRWQHEQDGGQGVPQNVDHQVRRYLRETLETLAY